MTSNTCQQLCQRQRVCNFVKSLSEPCAVCNQTSAAAQRGIIMMQHAIRVLGITLLGVALMSPVLLTGCAERATVRVYDPYYNDYHV